jgi:uncharacterized membrane protein (DUF2068 family)
VTPQGPKHSKQKVCHSGVSAGVRLIAAFKLFKGLLLLAVGVGVVKLLHKDMALEVERWIDMLRVDPHNHLIHHFLEKVSNVNPKKLKELSAGTFFYAGMLLTEGTGLLRGKRWAEYFTIVATSSFIPLEIYELHRRMDLASAALLLINIAVVIYLAFELARNRRRESA